MGATECHQIVLWEQLGDSKSLVLTYNNTSLYTWGFLDLEKDGPTVIELPPDVLGILDDGNMCYLSDMGAAGPDRGKGGKYLVLPPGYKDAFFLKDGIRRIDARLWMHYNVVCVTPAMAGIKPGVGSDYGIADLDSKHQTLDGAKTCKLHLPPNVPAKDEKAKYRNSQ